MTDNAKISTHSHTHTHTLRANEKNGLYFDDDVFNGAFFSTNFEHMYG